MRQPSELVDTFRANGLKVTPQRQLLFRLLHDNDEHPTADALYARASVEMPGISLRTVYQTLNDLTAMGELQQVAIGSGAAHFDPNVADHQHAVCDHCGAIVDVDVPGAGRLAIVGLDGFRVDHSAIVFHGSCRACADSSHAPLSSTDPTQHRPASTNHSKEHQ